MNKKVRSTVCTVYICYEAHSSKKTGMCSTNPSKNPPSLLIYVPSAQSVYLAWYFVLGKLSTPTTLLPYTSISLPNRATITYLPDSRFAIVRAVAWICPLHLNRLVFNSCCSAILIHLVNFREPPNLEPYGKAVCYIVSSAKAPGVLFMPTNESRLTREAADIAVNHHRPPTTCRNSAFLI